MRKTLFVLAFLLGCMGLQAQNFHMNVHRSSAVVYNHDVNDIENITFQDHDPVKMYITDSDGTSIFLIRKFDSITFTVGQIVPPAIGDDYMAICDSELPYTWQGVTFYAEGVQMLTLQTPQGADSIVMLHLTVNPTQTGDDYATICPNALPYTWQGVTFTAAGTQTVTLQSSLGCDSIVTLHLSVSDNIETEFWQQVCDSYVWNGTTYDTSGDYTQTFTSSQGCDSIVTLHLTISDNIHTDFTREACESYLWNGTTYNASGDYTQTFTSVHGCDSIVTLHLTIYHAQTGDDYMEICDNELPYIWQGVVFTTAGTRTVTLQTAHGCDSIVTLHLDVNPTQTSDDYLTINDNELPYTWQGVTFTEEGTQTVTLQTLHGCDSIVTLHLTVTQEPDGDTVYITYNGGSVNVINPFASTDVTISNNGADVTVNSTRDNVPYVVLGSSSNGSLTMYSSNSFFMALNNLSLTSTSTAAINIASEVDVTLQLRGNSTLVDNANSAINGALYAAGGLTIGGSGSMNITGNAKHGILVDGPMTVNSGTIHIVDTDSDAIHGSSNLVWNNGTLDITSAGSDGLDFSGTVTINNGDLSINTTTQSQRGIKVTGVFTMTNGALNLNVTGTDCKGIKGDSNIILEGGTIDMQVAGEGSNGISSDTDVTISGANITIVSTSLDGKCIKSDGTFHMSSGSINLSHSGDISKGVKTVGDITISGGTIVINSSGSTVVINNDPAYCTAIKGDANVIITGGNFTITLPTSNQGGKGISCAGNMTISGDNTINIETHGDGATYTASSGTDTYSSSCLRAEGNMEILSGNITLTSTGKAGKGIKVGTKSGNTYSGTYTQGNTDGTGPTLTISTSGAQLGSSGGGGGWPPGPGGGSSSTKSSSKAIKVGGLATINGGSTTITTSTNGAEGLESKTQIDINGGQHYFHCYDDCINSAGCIAFNGGVTVCFSNGNDAVDSNAGRAGAITIGNGVAFAYTTKGSPEEGFDCDNNNYIRITGTGIGISAGGSQGGGGGWPGGGGSGGTITNPAQGYKFYTSSYSFQTGRYYTLSNTSSSGGTNMVTFSFEANCSSTLALITATGMVSGNTYYVKYGNQAPSNPTTAFHGLYLGGTSSASTQAFSFTAQ